MSDSLNAMIADFQKPPGDAGRRARETQAKGIQAKEAEYQRRTQELEQKAQERQNELVQPILDKIKLAIEDVRAEGGYAMIFNADQGSPIVAAGQEPEHHAIACSSKLKRHRRRRRRVRARCAPPRPSGVTRPNARRRGGGLRLAATRDLGGEGARVLTAAAIAAAVGGTLHGDASTRVSAASRRSTARTRTHLTFLASAKYAPLLAAERTSASCSSRRSSRSAGQGARAHRRRRSRTRRCSPLLPLLYPPPAHVPGIHPTARSGAA